MKTISKVIYENQYTSPSKWGQRIESYIKIERHFDFKDGLRYSVTVPNFACCKRKLLDALLWAMEHESVLGAKYEGLKERIYKKRLWDALDIEATQAGEERG
ncbi:MAG: hypothetical protein EOM66_03105 [Clostridia bacterium]|nr:hypothetical protein [Clostridia bacterium]